ATLDYAAENLPKDGIEIVANEKYAIGQIDYRLSIQKIEQENPDYYLVFGVEPMNSVFLRQYYEITGNNNIASLGAFSNISTKMFPPINGVWSAYLVGGTEEFRNSYREEYGDSDIEACSANLYDGLDMIINAFETTELKDNEKIPNNANVLKNVFDIGVWEGAFGKMSVEKNGIVRTDTEIRTYKDGKWVKVEE
ncbi:MAG: ABC transporter substrate-binding protein, partial [Alphaproteobacteria bacterium]|nr:ABC transporter substrate-binding protein [Alphaproteobacteria bacterium]